MKTVSLIAAIAATISTLSLSAATHIVELSRYGIRPDRSTSVTAAINSAIHRITSSVLPSDTIIIKMTPGRYDFTPHKSACHTYYISNHDQDNPKNVGIAIDGATNVVLDGQGAELIFHGRMLPISVTSSASLTVKNLSIDFAEPHIAQVSIESVDTVAGTIAYRPAPWVDYAVENGAFVVKGPGWSHVPCVGIAFDKESRHIVYNTSDIDVGTIGVISIDNGVITAPWRNERLKPGMIVAMRTYVRPCPGIFIDDSRNVTIENVRIHYAEGMGLLAQNTTDITLRGFSVCLRGDTDPRYFTTQADATHFSSCAGHISSTGGLYEGMMDDAINVHGTYLKLQKRIDARSVEARYMHPQTFGFRWASPGDSIAFINSRIMEPTGGILTVEAIEPCDNETVEGASTFRITFTDDIDPEIDPDCGSFGLENLTMTPSVYFADNIIRNNRARGALFSTPRKVVVERNLFDHTSGSAILLCGDCNGWYETGACRDVTIRHNSFVNALTNLFQFTNAVISIYPEIPNLNGQITPFHSGITITDNTFDTFDVPLLYAKSVDGLTFTDNVIIHNDSYPPFHPNRAPVWLQHVDNARIQSESAR